MEPLFLEPELTGVKQKMKKAKIIGSDLEIIESDSDN